MNVTIIALADAIVNVTPSPPVAAEIFDKMRAMEHLRFTAFITDMALVTCSVWRATRHVFDGTPGVSGRLLKRVRPLEFGSHIVPYLSSSHGGRCRKFRTVLVRLG